MQKTLYSVPTMYGDHHVIEVRRILLGMPGVEDVNASSCFHTVEVSYDLSKVSAEEIETKLKEAGYLDELPTPVEAGAAAQEQRNGDAYFRHTTAFEQTKQVLNFARMVDYSGRALWPCPGIGVITAEELEKE